ncbi:hypothetical protein [Sphingomonas profundi]|uniref:hypothetical protein n=1 Tax=Alterirhizorhabdus profundi TaxID=2681549 RepID=UPI0012E84012|nr:hypothetical protein [Sphingomonas profundi]
MIEVEPLRDIAARRLSPHDIAAGYRQIDTVATRLYRRLTFFNVARSVLGSLGALMAAGGMAAAFHAPPHATAWLAEAFVAFGTAVVMASWLSGRLIQRRKRLFAAQPYDARLPSELVAVLRDLATGRLRAMMPVEYGAVSTSALRSVDGKIFETELVAGTFANRFAPILLLADPAKHTILWMPWGKGLGRSIYVVREEVGKSDEEAPSHNNDARDQWLVAGVFRDFKAGRDAFIAERIPPHNADWFRTVLTVGRREMRKGRQQGAQTRAIAVIQDELGNNLGPRGGESKHLIKQLLQGNYAGTDIKRYFAAPDT